MTASVLNAQVKTVYGSGVVTSIDDTTGIHTIRLTSWVLSNDSPVFVYTLPGTFEVIADDSAVAKEETKETKDEVKADVVAVAATPETTDAFAAGAAVKTPYGEGVVQSLDTDRGIYDVQLTNWVLSGNSRVHVYCGVDTLGAKEAATASVDQTAADVAAIATAPDAAVVDEKPAYELVPETLKVAAGTAVLTQYGAGKVTTVREDGIVEIELTNWVLSGDSRVHVYCTEAGFVIEGSPEAKQAENAAKENKTPGCCTIF